MTRQTFSVQLPGRPDPDWSAFPHAEVKVLAATRHSPQAQARCPARQSVRAGVCARSQGDPPSPSRCCNRSRSAACPITSASSVSVARAATWRRHGRCSRGAGSIATSARSCCRRRARRYSMRCWRHAWSRAYWDTPMEGEIWSLAGSRSWFGPEPFDATLSERLARGDIHPSGPLVGAWRNASQGGCRCAGRGDCRRSRRSGRRAGRRQDGSGTPAVADDSAEPGLALAGW